jgi:uncharacterized membrane protein YozB (DUF420 family)
MTSGLALTNTVLQVVLIAAALTAFLLARRRKFNRHCLIMRVSVAVQIILVATLMAPSLSTYLSHWGGWSWFTAEIIVHHTLGVIVVLMFIYFNLALTGVVRSPKRLRPYMRSALVLWLVTLAMGLHLYVYIWR